MVPPGMGEERDEMRGVDISEGIPETTLRPRGNSTSKVAEVNRYLLFSRRDYMSSTVLCRICTFTYPIENGFLR